MPPKRATPTKKSVSVAASKRMRDRVIARSTAAIGKTRPRGSANRQRFITQADIRAFPGFSGRPPSFTNNPEIPIGYLHQFMAMRVGEIRALLSFTAADHGTKTTLFLLLIERGLVQPDNFDGEGDESDDGDSEDGAGDDSKDAAQARWFPKGKNGEPKATNTIQEDDEDLVEEEEEESSEEEESEEEEPDQESDDVPDDGNLDNGRKGPTFKDLASKGSKTKGSRWFTPSGEPTTFTPQQEEIEAETKTTAVVSHSIP